jgi:hypothetical protein
VAQQGTVEHRVSGQLAAGLERIARAGVTQDRARRAYDHAAGARQARDQRVGHARS